MLIGRACLRAQVSKLLQQFRGVLRVGPRQVGKTTLARSFVPSGNPNCLDLEDPVVAEQFRAAKALLSAACGLVVTDEVQHAPNLFPLLRVRMDRESAPAKFLLLGSVAMPLLGHGSESLLGGSPSSRSAALRSTKSAPATPRGCGGAAARRRRSSPGAKK